MSSRLLMFVVSYSGIGRGCLGRGRRTLLLSTWACEETKRHSGERRVHARLERGMPDQTPATIQQKAMDFT